MLHVGSLLNVDEFLVELTSASGRKESVGYERRIIEHLAVQRTQANATLRRGGAFILRVDYEAPSTGEHRFTKQQRFRTICDFEIEAFWKIRIEYRPFGPRSDCIFQRKLNFLVFAVGGVQLVFVDDDVR